MTVTRTIPRKLMIGAALLAMLTGTAAAQLMPSISLPSGAQKKLTPEEQEKQDALDNAYKSATNKIPDQKLNDPWATVRPAPAMLDRDGQVVVWNRTAEKITGFPSIEIVGAVDSLGAGADSGAGRCGSG